MLSRLKTYLAYGSHFCGIEHTSKNNESIIYATLLKKSKNSLDTKDVFQAKIIDNICSSLPKKQHVFLIINNDQVLNKMIEGEQRDSKRLVNKAFPNINFDDFYFEILSQNNRHFISICRKGYVQDLIKAYQKNDISIIDFGLGNLVVSSLLDYIHLDNVTTSNTFISIEDAMINSIESTQGIQDSTYTINSLKTTNNQLLSLSGALQPVLQNSITKTNFDGLKSELNGYYKQSRFFSEFLKFSLIFFFGLLLLNFLFFNHYHDKVNALNQLSDVNKTSKDLALKLSEDVDKKENMVDDMLMSGSSKSSFFTNAIVQSLPETITLSSLNYQPLLKRVKEEKPIEIKYNTMLILGVSSDSESFSEWISQLERKPWVKKIDINYGQDGGSHSNFKILIQINDDQ